MKNNWTYGQYAIFRMIFGAYLIVHFSLLLPYANELFSNKGMLKVPFLSPLNYLFPNILALVDFPIGIICFAIGCSFFFFFGKYDRIASVSIWYVLTCLFDRNPFIQNPSLPYIGWLLIAHALLPSKENWSMPKGIFFSAWAILAIGYTYSGITKLVSPSWVDGTAIFYVLHNPLARTGFARDVLLALPSKLLKIATWAGLFCELFFLLLCFFTRVRPWIWLLLFSMHIFLMSILRFADLSFGMLLIHFFTFDPHWIKPKRSKPPMYVFYDGDCGLCNSFVQFVVKEMDLHAPFQFAPLGGVCFQEKIKEPSSLPDSIVVYEEGSQSIVVKSSAVLLILQNLGGIWRLFAIIFGCAPLFIRNFIYDFVAKVRKKVKPRKKVHCSLLSKEQAKFFVA